MSFIQDVLTSIVFNNVVATEYVSVMSMAMTVDMLLCGTRTINSFTARVKTVLCLRMQTR